MKFFNIILIELVILFSLFTLFLIDSPYATTGLMKNEIIIRIPKEDLNYIPDDLIYELGKNVYVVELKNSVFMKRMAFAFFIIKMPVIVCFMLIPIVIVFIRFFLKRKREAKE